MSNVEINQNFIIIASHITYSKTCTFVRNFARNSSRTGRIFLYVILIGLLSSCRNGNRQAIDETPTRGNIKIAVDESFQPLIDTEVYTFTSLYRNAKVKPLYKPEYDVVNDFMNDSVKLMVTSRKLSDSQIQYLRDTLIVARTITFAYDALALITNKENPDTLIKYNSVKDIFSGRIQNWKEVNQKSKLGRINVIFDNNKSGNIRYFRELFEITG